jgi:3-deoxy-manno-octulosonate cytidylyltransferase (CMP-KDO synthetase)
LFKERDIGIVIPARYASTRLPGKPMIDINGKTMINRTWERCCQAMDRGQVFIATESDVIAEHVQDFGGNVIRTSAECLTGTDRVAEANQTLNFELVINVQGDEPIINPVDIAAVVKRALEMPDHVVNGCARITTELEFLSPSIPKVVFGVDGDLMYASRSPIPGSKDGNFYEAHKQICIYAFPKKYLSFFGVSQRKSFFEGIEDIEILRFLELGVKVNMVELSGKSFAVDTFEDLANVKKMLTVES